MGQTTDVLGQTVMAAAERFCTTTNVSPTRKRLLYEFLSMLGPNNKTLSGLSKPGIEVQPAARAGRQCTPFCCARNWFGEPMCSNGSRCRLGQPTGLHCN